MVGVIRIYIPSPSLDSNEESIHQTHEESINPIFIKQRQQSLLRLELVNTASTPTVVFHLEPRRDT